MVNFPFYAVAEDEASILRLLDASPSYPNAKEFAEGLRESMQYCGDDWPLKGDAFQNYMKDIRPALQQEHALLKMYFFVRTREAEMSPEQELVEMRRYGRCSLSDALYLIGSLQRARDGTPLSFAMARQAGPSVVKSFWETPSFDLNTAVKQFQRFKNDPDSRQTPEELRYGFSELERASKRYQSGETAGQISQGVRRFLIAQSGIDPEDAEAFADILTSFLGFGALFQRTREEEKRRREAEAAEMERRRQEAERRRREAEAAEMERRRREAEAVEMERRRREAAEMEQRRREAAEMEQRRREAAEAEQRRREAEAAEAERRRWEAEAAEAEQRLRKAEAEAAEAERRRREAEAGTAEAERRRREAEQQPYSRPSKKRKKGGLLMPILVAVLLFFVLHGMFSQNDRTSAPPNSPQQPTTTPQPSQPSGTAPAPNVPTDSGIEGGNSGREEPTDTEAYPQEPPAEESPNAELEARLNYFMKNCGQEYFDKSRFAGFDKERCLYARNAIYAQAGRMFSDNSSLQTYYSQFDWYQPSIPPEEFRDSMLNRYQTVNLYRMLSYETERGYRSEQYAQSYNRLKEFIDNCDSRVFSKSQLSGFDEDMCMLARNAIYAKSGRKFKSEYLTAYFNECVSWYDPRIEPDDFRDDLLNACQTANRDMVVEYETEKGFR